MLEQPAVLLIEYADGTVETKAGNKGDIYTEARNLIEALCYENPGVYQVLALDKRGVLKGKKFHDFTPSPAAPAASVAPAADESADEPDTDAQESNEGDDEAEAKELRAKLRAAKIPYSPRSGIDLLRKMVADAGL